MPLPLDNSGQWPPYDFQPYFLQSTAAMAWWTGSLDDLRNTSGGDGQAGRKRFFQRRKTNDAATITSAIHVPVAADIAAVSADLLFADGFQLTTDDEAAQAELENLEEQIGLVNLFAEGAEWASASGGVYLRAGWDKVVADHPLSTVVPQSAAIPDFRYGKLAGVTLWRDVFEDRGKVYRLLERHEPGLVLSGLYEGSKLSLGTRIAMDFLPQTAGTPEEIILTGKLAGRLLVQYVPNVRPNRPLPWMPLGRADWLGCEPMLDALDEVWTSLIRDVRLAQAHVIVPQEWLKLAGNRPGQTVSLDVDNEVWTAFEIPESNDGKVYTPSVLQPDIRVEEHLAAAMAIIERIVSAAGYSPQSFGLQIEGRAESGTALRVRKDKTASTQAKKRRYWQPELRRHAQLLLDIGAEVFGSATIEDTEKAPVKVEWPKNVDPAEQATLIQALRAAQAVSIDHAVRLAQPDLEDTEVDAEVERIKDESSVADPTHLGIVPPDPNDPAHQEPPVDPKADPKADPNHNPGDVAPTPKA